MPVLFGPGSIAFGRGAGEYPRGAADLLGISQSYISRLEKRIMARLRRELTRQL